MLLFMSKGILMMRKLLEFLKRKACRVCVGLLNDNEEYFARDEVGHFLNFWNLNCNLCQ